VCFVVPSALPGWPGNGWLVCSLCIARMAWQCLARGFPAVPAARMAWQWLAHVFPCPARMAWQWLALGSLCPARMAWQWLAPVFPCPARMAWQWLAPVFLCPARMAWQWLAPGYLGSDLRNLLHGGDQELSHAFGSASWFGVCIRDSSLHS
jgi:hypothetical protein